MVATLDLAESLGLSRALICHEISLNENVAESPRGIVPSSAIIDAIEFAAWRTQRADFGLMLAQRRDHLNLGLLGLLLEQCETVAEVHEVGQRYLHLHNGALVYDLTKERTRAVIRLSIHTRSRYQPRHYVEALLAMHLRVLCLVLGQRWMPQAVYFMHEQIGNRSGYERRFGRGVRFQQKFNGIILKLSDVHRRAPSRNPATKLKLENLLRELDAGGAAKDPKAEVARLVRILLPSGGANVKRIAGLMATSTRSLQRKLLERGTSFNRVVAETRAAMAREYLGKDGLTLNKIAPLLGFSEPSAVSRFLSKKAHTSARDLKGRSRP